MKTLNLILTAYFLIFGICSPVADVPATINFQGALKDENGEPVNDTKICGIRKRHCFSGRSF